MKTKQQAADYLHVSTRAIERYTAKQKLNPHYDRDDGGRLIALYDDAELERVKQEMETHALAPPKPKPIRERSSSQALTTRRAGNSPALAELVAAIEAARVSARPVVSLESKMVLSLEDAAALSGLSAGYLRAAIHAKKLKARKGIGRGWRIKRTDLDAYVRKL